MIAFLLLTLFFIIFFELFVFLQTSKDAMAIVKLTQQSMRALLSAGIGDDERETVVRRASADILKATSRLAAKLLFIGLALCLLFLLTVSQFPHLRNAMLASLVSPVVIMLLTTAAILYAIARRAIVIRL